MCFFKSIFFIMFSVIKNTCNINTPKLLRTVFNSKHDFCQLMALLIMKAIVMCSNLSFIKYNRFSSLDRESSNKNWNVSQTVSFCVRCNLTDFLLSKSICLVVQEINLPPLTSIFFLNINFDLFETL